MKVGKSLFVVVGLSVGETVAFNVGVREGTVAVTVAVGVATGVLTCVGAGGLTHAVRISARLNSSKE